MLIFSRALCRVKKQRGTLGRQYRNSARGYGPSLADVCGANDYNLRVMEKLFGSRVFCRGNELFLESSNPDAQALFHSLVERLLESIGEGLPPSPDLIIALHTDLTPEGQESVCADSEGRFLNACVQIPGGGKAFPRSKSQALYLKGLSTHDLTMVVGPAGTGKTYLAVAWALREILTKSKRKLVLTRPVVEAG